MENKELEDRAFRLAQDIRAFVRKVPRSRTSTIDIGELVKASGCAGSECVSAVTASVRKEFVCRIRLARRETKKSAYWLKLLYLEDNAPLEQERARLLEECGALIDAYAQIADFDLRHLRF